MDKLICVGKNYLKHAQELGDAVPEEPIYFFKPPSAALQILEAQTQVVWPSEGELHHELELCLRIQKQGPQMGFSHFTFGLDMTLRDRQSQLKKLGLPWEKAKVFRNACILGPWRPLPSLAETLAIEFELKINGERRQIGRGLDMRWKPDAVLLDLQKYFPVLDGDVLFTGTPEGVGPVQDGDQLEITASGVNYTLKTIRR